MKYLNHKSASYLAHLRGKSKTWSSDQREVSGTAEAPLAKLYWKIMRTGNRLTSILNINHQ